MSERAKVGLVSLGVAVAAAGAGAALGVAAERLALGRSLLPHRGEPEETDWTGLHVPGRYIEADDGTTLYVEVDEVRPRRGGAAAPPEPAPVTVVFSHGYCLTMDSWYFQRAALRGRYRLVFADQRGHGWSAAGPEGSNTVDQLGSDLGRVIDAVAPRGPLVLIGHSMGGMTILSLMVHRPDLAGRVTGVGLVSTSAGGLRELDLGMAYLGRLVQRFAPGTLRTLNRSPRLVENGRRVVRDIETVFVRRYSYVTKVSPDLVRFTAQMIAATSVDVIADYLPTFGRHDKREALARIGRRPMLVLVGDSDLLTPPGHSRDLVRQVPTAQLVVVPHAGHLVMLEHPEVVTGHLADLIGRSGGDLGRARLPSAIERRRTRRPDGVA